VTHFPSLRQGSLLHPSTENIAVQTNEDISKKKEGMHR